MRISLFWWGLRGIGIILLAVAAEVANNKWEVNSTVDRAMYDSPNGEFAGDEVLLPEDWWKQENVARNLHLWFRRHAIALTVGYTINDEPCCSFYTGFLFYYRDEFMWLTAGHVLEEVNAIFRSDCCVIRSVAWIDNEGVNGLAKIPIVYERLEKFKVDDREFDVGAVIFGNLDLQAIRKNEENVWLDGESCKGICSGSWDGFYLLGYPTETARTQEYYERTKGHFRYDTQLVCIPIERIEPDEKGEFWNHPGWFYGKIVPVKKDDGRFLESIKGMSGGPIIAFKVTSGGEIKYGPFAIQSGWLEKSGILCATPIDSAMKAIDEFFDGTKK